MSHQVINSVFFQEDNKEMNEFNREMDARSIYLMIEYFMEDEEYKEFFDEISKLSPSSLRLLKLLLSSDGRPQQDPMT